MGVGKKKYDGRSTLKSLSKYSYSLGEMAERFKAVDCKSIGFSHRRFESYFLLLLYQKSIYSKYGVVGSAPVLGTGGHVFKSHYFEITFLLVVNL